MQRVPFCETCYKPYALQGSGRPVGQRIPKLLDCSHTFCQGCVTKLVGNEARAFDCPACKEQTLLPGGKKDIKNLPTNLYILGVLINNVRANIEKDITKGDLICFELEKSLINVISSEDATDGRGQDGVQGEHNVCDECCKDDAVSRCKKCEAIFCEKCFNSVHLSSRTLSTHKPSPITLLNQDEMVTETCTTHKGRELEFYDHTDETLICSLCIVTPAYQGHKIVSIHELSEEMTEKVNESLQDVKKVHAQLQKSKERLTLLFPEIKTEFSETVQHIREHFQDLHTKLQAREINLIKETKDAYCRISFPREVANEVKQQNEEITTLIQHATAALSSPSFMMKNGDKLLSKMADFKDIPCILSESLLQDLVKITYPKDFQDAMNSYGTIVSESSTQKLNKISDQPSDNDEKKMQDIQVSKEKPKSNSSQRQPCRQNLVTVSHICTPTDFYIQHVADTEALENLMDAIQTHCQRTKSMDDMVRTTAVGDMVFAKGESDQWWYRARIISDQQSTCIAKSHNQPVPKVKVYLVDYGNTMVVRLNRLRKMAPKFTELPELATNCSLVQIVPPAQCNTWSNGSIKAFGSMVRDKRLLMGVARKSGGKLLVDLKNPDSDTNTTNDKPASVRDALVFLEVAHFFSPASVSNPDVSFPVQTYQNVLMPQEGEAFQVTVTYIENPDTLYVQKYEGKEYDEMLKVLQQMMNVYTSKNGDQWLIGWPYVNMVCAARFSTDENWYRALVTDVSADQVVSVLYIDFGNSEELPFREIRRLPDHLVRLPKQAMKCRLAGIQPVDEQTGWTDECNTFLNDNCFLHPYNMKVVEAEGDEPMSVILHLPTPQQNTSLNKQLVSQSHAAFSSDEECLEEQSVEDTSSVASNNSTSNSSEKLLNPQRLAYIPVDVPETNQFQFLVTYVDKDCTISGFQPDKCDHSLAYLMKQMQNICKDSDSSAITQDQLSLNQPCCAKFSDDNTWYRAQIVGFPTPSTVLVDYVDFGNGEELPLTSLSLNAAFLDIPKQCIPLKLDGLPQTAVEQEKVSMLLRNLLVGEICDAETEIITDGVINIKRLTLPNGTDVVETAAAMMSKEREKSENPDVDQPPERPSTRENRAGKKMTSLPAKSLLVDTVLPAEGIPFDVAVTEINSKSVMFLQRDIPFEDDQRAAVSRDPTHIIARDHLQQMLDMSNRINLKNYFKGKREVSNVWSNMLCCARYTEDDFWYRAQVIEVVNNDPLQARVLYLDYGTSEVIGLERIKPFTAELASIPKQAFQCTVVGLSGKDNDDDDDDDDDDSDDDIDALAKAVTNKKLVCKIVNFGSPITVELYERVLTEDSYCEVPINQRLSELAALSGDLDEEEVDDLPDDLENVEVDDLPGDLEKEKHGALLPGDSAKEEDDASEVNEEDESSAVIDEDEREDFTSDVNPVGDWYTECEEAFMKYDREGRSTRPKLLTPAQFVLKKDNVVEHDKTPEAEEESEVD